MAAHNTRASLGFDEAGKIKPLQVSAQGVEARPVKIVLTMSDTFPRKSGEDVTMNVAALSKGDKIKSVQLFANDKLVGSVNRAPFQWKWQSMQREYYRVYAKATLQSKEECSSAEFNFDVE
jgi:hypothetical protein